MSSAESKNFYSTYMLLKHVSQYYLFYLLHAIIMYAFIQVTLWPLLGKQLFTRLTECYLHQYLFVYPLFPNVLRWGLRSDYINYLHQKPVHLLLLTCVYESIISFPFVKTAGSGITMHQLGLTQVQRPFFSYD